MYFYLTDQFIDVRSSERKKTVSFNNVYLFISISLKCMFHNKNLIILEVYETQRLDEKDDILLTVLLQ